MRTPSPDPYASTWHSRAICGFSVPVHEDNIEAGFYKVRTAPFARTWYPAAIWWEGETDELGELVSDEVLRCHIAGLEYDPYEQWLRLAKYPISREEYEALMEGLKDERAHT